MVVSYFVCIGKDVLGFIRKVSVFNWEGIYFLGYDDYIFIRFWKIKIRSL